MRWSWFLKRHPGRHLKELRRLQRYQLVDLCHQRSVFRAPFRRGGMSEHPIATPPVRLRMRCADGLVALNASGVRFLPDRRLRKAQQAPAAIDPKVTAPDEPWVDARRAPEIGQRIL